MYVRRAARLPRRPAAWCTTCGHIRGRSRMSARHWLARTPCHTSRRHAASPPNVSACGTPGRRTSRKPCRTSHIHAASPPSVSACAYSNGRTRRTHCRTSRRHAASHPNVRVCTVRLLDVENALPQVSHSKQPAGGASSLLPRLSRAPPPPMARPLRAVRRRSSSRLPEKVYLTEKIYQSTCCSDGQNVMVNRWSKGDGQIDGQM